MTHRDHPALVLHAANQDRAAGDLPLLHAVLERECERDGGRGAADGLRMAAVLIGVLGGPADHARLVALAGRSPLLSDALGEHGFPGTAAEVGAWAAALDAGEDAGGRPDGPGPVGPRDRSAFAWAALAAAQGNGPLVRGAFLRLLDGAGPRDGRLLGLLATGLDDLGAYRHAARAQRLHASLLDEPWDRGAALAALARLQRRAGDPEAALASLDRAAGVLEDGLGPHFPAPTVPTTGWRDTPLGARLARERARVTDEE
ncbi:hypothetical protein [Streptomyces sp. NPDC090022]|uniref:hypothetical protein n=1 Tax=Streptomyces sp. NPDC090022 TaxID=3365920 RepID=UPI003822FA84